MQSVSSSSRLDQLGVVASSVCAVHCALGPLMLGASGLAGSLVQDERVEAVLLLSAVVVAVSASTMGYRRHRDRRVVSLVVAGLLLVSVGRFFEPPFPEPMFPIAAAGLLIGAHARNALLLHRLRACGRPGDGCGVQRCEKMALECCGRCCQRYPRRRLSLGLVRPSLTVSPSAVAQGPRAAVQSVSRRRAPSPSRVHRQLHDEL